MIIYPVCSSSKGNCLYVQGEEGKAILIDLGIGVRTLDALLQKANFSLNNVVAVFLTHEHADHVSGLGSFVKNFKKIPVFGSKKTLNSLAAKGMLSCYANVFEFNCQKIKVADLSVSSFEVSHDCFCLAFCIFCGLKKLSICTDLGCITSTVLNNLVGSNFVFLESNFDVKMLREGVYPAFLKKRITSKFGHLSNNDASKLICWLVFNGVNRFLLGHLSQNNNMPYLAKQTVISSLAKYHFKQECDYFLDVASVKGNGVFYEV